MAEDPLERIAREERERKNNSLRMVTIVLAAVCAILLVALGYITYRNAMVRKAIQASGTTAEGGFYTLVSELNDEKQDLVSELEQLKSDYDSLSSDYDSINSQLDTSRAEVAALLEKIKSTDATNRAKMRQYEKELGTLRSIMRNYIV